MSFAQAVVYFLREAAVNLVRSWKVSLLAVLTIALSLSVGGTFLLLSQNLAGALVQWRQESRLVIYLETSASDEALSRLAAEVAEAPWVTAVETVTQEQAQQRFQHLFPGLSDLVEGWGDEPLPASVEIAFELGPGQQGAFEQWAGQLRQRPAVAMVDDDRDWLEQLGTLLLVVRALGAGLALVLLGAAVFTIASVVRLTAYLYHEEIAIMRLVGATEFFIRGPFYAEGLLQGLLGGLLAAGALAAGYQVAAASIDASSWSALLVASFLPPAALAFLVLLGGAAGLGGAVASLRREALEEPAAE